MYYVFFFCLLSYQNKSDSHLPELFMGIHIKKRMYEYCRELVSKNYGQNVGDDELLRCNNRIDVDRMWICKCGWNNFTGNVQFWLYQTIAKQSTMISVFWYAKLYYCFLFAKFRCKSFNSTRILIDLTKQKTFKTCKWKLFDICRSWVI